LNPRQHAQASIEYLLLFAVLLFFFASMLPVMQKSYALAFFAADVSNANAFASTLQSRANELDVLGNGSMLALYPKPLESWELEAQENTLSVKVENQALGREKIFHIVFPNNLSFPKTLVERNSVLLLKKENNVLSLEHS